MQSIEMAHLMMQASAMHHHHHHQYMHQLPAQPPAPYVLTFGKYVGKPLAEVPADYKEWLVFHKFHLRKPELYEALDLDGYFRPKPKPAPRNETPSAPAPANCEASNKRAREDECVDFGGASKRQVLDHVGGGSDEVAQWCRSNSDDIAGWEGEDNFLGLYDKEGALNQEEVNNDSAFDAVLLLEDGASNDFDPEDYEAAHSPPDCDEEASRAETPAVSETQQLGVEGKKINEGFELQAVLVDAFQAFERGDCKVSLKLLRSSIHKVIQLEPNLNEQEKACMQQTLVTVVHAARMIACKFRDQNNTHLIAKGDEYRRGGLYEVAVLMYAEAVDLSSSN
mmetsp:Transcript_3322/g.7821  ORF Transcript_3322/g.7821 Transcript_3322/m.7821 type:complete len:338 (-) Transcript_3322:45-1058(-)